MKLAITFSLLLIFAAPLCAETIYVPDDYPDPRLAIDASVDGDTIIVRPGTYYTNFSFKGKLVTLKSEQGPEATVLDGGQIASVVVFKNSETRDAVLDGFTITNGFATEGGGIFSQAGPSIINNIITKNAALEDGGGFHGAWGHAGLIANNVISDNWAWQLGGGISMQIGTPWVINNIIHDNTADVGGGVYSGPYTSAIFVNNTLYGNEAFTAGGGATGLGFFRNCIFWNNGAPVDPELQGSSSTAYCCIQGGWPGTNNIDADPLFVAPDQGDFHLAFDSPCRDAGDSSLIYIALEDRDFEGDQRIAHGGVDIGGDEFHTHLYYGGDAVPGGVVQGKLIGLPGTSQVGLWFGSGFLESPIPSAFGPWYLEFPLVGPFILWPIPANGVEILPEALLPSEIPAPYDLPMQAIVGNELTNLSVIRVR